MQKLIKNSRDDNLQVDIPTVMKPVLDYLNTDAAGMSTFEPSFLLFLFCVLFALPSLIIIVIIILVLCVLHAI